MSSTRRSHWVLKTQGLRAYRRREEEEGEGMVAEPDEGLTGLALVLDMGVSRHSQID